MKLFATRENPQGLLPQGILPPLFGVRLFPWERKPSVEYKEPSSPLLIRTIRF